MIKLGYIIKHLLNEENWNIGFVDNFTAKDLLWHKRLPKVSWMKHSYKDRAFADPHILDVSDNEIVVLCEELVFGHKGIISKLVVSRKDFSLIDRKELLKLDTHLSYPAIIRKDDKVYIYPENSEAAEIKLYELDTITDRLKKVSVVVLGEVTDFTIFPNQQKGTFFALATKLHPDSEENAYLFESQCIFGPYKQVYKSPVVTSRSCSRPAGDFFEVNGEIYRPAQNCVGHYGKAIKIMKVNSFDPFEEAEQFELKPSSFRFHRGIHTLNFKENLTVIDGYGYLHPFVGRLICPINRFRLRLKGV